MFTEIVRDRSVVDDRLRYSNDWQNVQFSFREKYIIDETAGATPPAQCVTKKYTDNYGVTRTACFKVVSRGRNSVVYGNGGGRTYLHSADAGGAILAPADHKGKFTKLTNASGAREWRFTSEDNNQELYAANGRLIATVKRGGYRIDYVHNEIIEAGVTRLGNVVATDSFGRVETFQINPEGHVQSVVDANGLTYAYGYDSKGNVAQITFPDGSVKSYLYNETAYTSGANLPSALTGIIDENAVRFSTYKYGSDNRVTSTEEAGGVSKYLFSYDFANYQTVYGTKVTDPLGTQRQYNFQVVNNVIKTTGVSQPCSGCGGAQSLATIYDSNSNIASRTDFNGRITTYAYDLARNLETSRTEASATAQARTITTTWNATYRLPATIIEPAPGGTKTTTFTYDASGNLTQKTVTAPKNDGTTATETRAWVWTYNTLGQMLTAKDPLNRTTTYVYAAATDTAVPPKFTKGDLQTMSNAAGLITTYNEYDKAGRLLKMTDANGLITTMTYQPRGWLATRAVANGTSTETTTYTYDNVGQLTKVTLPDGSNLFYAYDAAHRLIGMAEQSTGASPLANGNMIVTAANLTGDRIAYTLDNMGNRIKEEHFDSIGSVQKQRSRVLNGLNQLQKDVGGTDPTNQITQYTYDGNGNQLTSTDPLARTSTNAYDPLNRLISMIDPVNGNAGATIYTYDAANNLTSVKDPKGLTTTYTYNGHNNLIAQQSPDTGATAFKYDANANLTAKLDAAGRCTVNTYDTLHRIKTNKYFAATAATNTALTCVSGTAVVANETITYTYDSITATVGGVGGKGRLGQFADGTGNTKYVYDKNGRVLTKVQTTTGTTNTAKTIAYTYNAFGQLASTVTPSGQTLTYTYSQNRIIGVKVNGADVVKGAIYEPFGPNGGWSWGNHGTLIGGSTINQHQRVYDLDYRPIAIKSDPQGYSRNIQWDIASRLIGQTDGASVNPAAALSQTYGYDNLDRLTSFTPGAGSVTAPQVFTYDAIGNRATLQASASGVASTGANTATYTYPGTSHRLQNITGNIAKNFMHDATGNTLNETGGATHYAFNFDHKNRLQSVQVGASAADTVTYAINALGQRVRKLGAGTQATNAAAQSKTARFIYDEQGRLVGEYDIAGKLLQETVWMNDLPIATIRPKGANASAPLGTTGTGVGTANNVGTNTQANPVNIDFFYVHPDHLGTPSAVTKPADNSKVWEWQSQPFGESATNENPQNGALPAAQFRYNLRFPGQFYDAESGKHYNYFRDYDPSIGRYVESDPIGLAAGVNTFGYVMDSPIKLFDKFGLDVTICFYPDAARGLGHIGAGIGGSGGDTIGQYPEGPQMDEQKKSTRECKTLPSDNDKDKCMMDCMLKPTPYSLTRNNCAQRTRDCGVKCGIFGQNLPPRTPFPRHFMQFF